ncbi:MAG TPA: hypothetical protein VHT01_01665 [Candidatus Udaeobacter sp.]|nr:hypothetical protein [Candidatus Udaeobacter sp.]
MQLYEVPPRKDKRGVDLISDALPFGRLWYGEPSAVINAIGHAQHYRRPHHAVIRLRWIRQHDRNTRHNGDFKEW